MLSEINVLCNSDSQLFSEVEVVAFHGICEERARLVYRKLVCRQLRFINPKSPGLFGTSEAPGGSGCFLLPLCKI